MAPSADDEPPPASDAINSPNNITGSKNTSSSPHTRSPSGNSLLSKIPFLRSSDASMNASPPASKPARPTVQTALPPTPSSPEYMRSPPNSAQRPSKTRSRKGSLRKTALLGTGQRRWDRLETITSPRLADVPPPLPSAGTRRRGGEGTAFPVSGPLDGDDEPTPRASFDPSGGRAAVAGNNGGRGPASTSSEEGPAITRRATARSDMGGSETRSDVSTTTTDEDDIGGAGPAGAVGGVAPAAVAALKQQLSADASYFSFRPRLLQRASGGGAAAPAVAAAPSPLATLPMETAPTPEDWDYAETEWWGWIILIVTWVVFVVGMGSCFGVWSWAWDVGETPYAPPELEDDPTLPIVGYYPALIILTGVMAWVWVLISWVGMKYFKHAKMPGEDV